MRTSVGNKQTKGPIWEFYTILGVYFNGVRAVFLDIFKCIQTDRQTDGQRNIQRVSFYNLIQKQYENKHIFERVADI